MQTILIVEDDPVIREELQILAHLLRHAGVWGISYDFVGIFVRPPGARGGDAVWCRRRGAVLPGLCHLCSAGLHQLETECPTGLIRISGGTAQGNAAAGLYLAFMRDFFPRVSPRRLHER